MNGVPDAAVVEFCDGPQKLPKKRSWRPWVYLGLFLLALG